MYGDDLTNNLCVFWIACSQFAGDQEAAAGERLGCECEKDGQVWPLGQGHTHRNVRLYLYMNWT